MKGGADVCDVSVTETFALTAAENVLREGDGGGSFILMEVMKRVAGKRSGGRGGIFDDGEYDEREGPGNGQRGRSAREKGKRSREACVGVDMWKWEAVAVIQTRVWDNGRQSESHEAGHTNTLT